MCIHSLVTWNWHCSNIEMNNVSNWIDITMFPVMDWLLHTVTWVNWIYWLLRAFFFVRYMHFSWRSSPKKITISLWLWAAEEIYYLDGWGLPRNVYYLAVQGCQGISITWRLSAVKEYQLLGGWYLPRKFINLMVLIFSWRIGNLRTPMFTWWSCR